jgi:hypothetical protein
MVSQFEIVRIYEVYGLDPQSECGHAKILGKLDARVLARLQVPDCLGGYTYARMTASEEVRANENH